MGAIKFIPNQPISFDNATDSCNDDFGKCYCVKVAYGDKIQLQFKQEPTGDNLICDGNFEVANTELFTNGEFVGNATGWTLSSLAYGSNKITQSSGTTGYALQTFGSLDPLVIYRIRFTVSGYTAGNVKGQLGTYISPVIATADGDYELFATYVSGGYDVGVYTDSSFRGSIDNLRLDIVGVNNGCWTSNQGWSRVDDGAKHLSGIDVLTLVTPPLTYGSYYQVKVSVKDMSSGQLSVAMGAVVEIITVSGDYIFYMIAAPDENIVFLPTTDFNGTLYGVEVYELYQNFDVQILDDHSVSVWSFSPVITNEFITVGDTTDTIVLPYGKYEIQVIDPATSEVFTSNCIDHKSSFDCSKMVVANCCDNAFGFEFKNSGFTLAQRISLIKFNPRYPVKQNQVVSSAGNNSRPYAERDKIIQLKTDYIDEITHDALSTQFICDTLLIDDIEYFWFDNEYKPTWSNNGRLNVSMLQTELKKKEEAIIYKANCGNCVDDDDWQFMMGFDFTGFANVDLYSVTINGIETIIPGGIAWSDYGSIAAGISVNIGSDFIPQGNSNAGHPIDIIWSNGNAKRLYQSIKFYDVVNALYYTVEPTSIQDTEYCKYYLSTAADTLSSIVINGISYPLYGAVTTSDYHKIMAGLGAIITQQLGITDIGVRLLNPTSGQLSLEIRVPKDSTLIFNQVGITLSGTPYNIPFSTTC